MDKNAISDIIAVGKRMDSFQLVNTFTGNVSIKKDDLIYISPSRTSKATLTEDMVSVINKDGEKISGLKPSSELSMHSLIYNIRDDIGGIVHSHAPFLTAFSFCNKNFELLASAEFILDFKVIEVLPYGRPGTAELCNGAEKLLAKGRNVFLLANHGVISVGGNLWEALDRLEAAEQAAKTYTISKIIGTPVDLSKDEIDYFMSL